MILIDYKGSIDPRNTQKLFDSLNQAVKTSIELSGRLLVKIYYSSPGGYLDSARDQIHALNSSLDFCDVEIIANGVIMSAAVDVLTEFKGKVSYSKDVLGMVHLADVELSHRDLKDSKSYSALVQTSVKKQNRSQLTKLKPFLTELQYKDLSTGKEVYFLGDSFKKLINDLKAKKTVSGKSTKQSKKKPSKSN